MGLKSLIIVLTALVPENIRGKLNSCAYDYHTFLRALNHSADCFLLLAQQISIIAFSSCPNENCMCIPLIFFRLPLFLPEPNACESCDCEESPFEGKLNNFSHDIKIPVTNLILSILLTAIDS